MRSCCPVCRPRDHVFEPTLSKFRDLLLECLIYQYLPRASFVLHSHVHTTDDTVLFFRKPMLPSYYVCASQPRRSLERLHLLSGLACHAVTQPHSISDPLYPGVPRCVHEQCSGWEPTIKSQNLSLHRKPHDYPQQCLSQHAHSFYSPAVQTSHHMTPPLQTNIFVVHSHSYYHDRHMRSAQPCFSRL